MEIDPKDYDVVKLLTKLKNNNGAYPPDLLTPRRQTYVRRVAEIGLGFGVAAGMKTTVKSAGKVGGFSTTAGGLIEAALVVAIVTEAGAAAYVYRDRIAALFQRDTTQPKVLEVTTIPETEFSPNLPAVEIFEPTEATTITAETPSGTPVPGAAANNNDQNNQGVQGNSTPDPNGNNGNHFGQTPRPDRPDDPDGGGNNNNGNGNGNDR
jgi:hypothetical protein